MGSAFDRKTVIVTGAGAGIGRATAVRFAREGARVVAVDIDAARLADLRESHRMLEIDTVVADVATQTGVDAAVAAAGETIDVLANVAGVMDAYLPAAEMTDELWDRVVAVNTTAVMRLMRAVIPTMLIAGHGVIVNVSGESALRGSAAGLACTASKHAVTGMTQHTAFTYGPLGVRCNAVAPGSVRGSHPAAVGSTVAAKRITPLTAALGEPRTECDDVAAVILWLAGDDAACVNGTTVACDSGLSAV